MQNDTQSQTESLLEIIKGIDGKSILLPEFQRDFRWELEQTYELFDSLISDIFIGTLIYGKPSFGMTLREIDNRKRKRHSGDKKPEIFNYTDEEIKRESQQKNLRIVLDGQQRITSIYRAITGTDTVFLILRKELIHQDEEAINKLSLEEMVERIAGEEDSEAVCIKLADAYIAETKLQKESAQINVFKESIYGKACLQGSQEVYQSAENIYLAGMYKLRNFYNQQKMVAFYLLDMDLPKFCTFFERSNSKGIQLNFTDILAAKLYRGFNLRDKIEEFEDTKPDSIKKINREVIVRTIAYLVTTEKGLAVSIEKKDILKNLEASDFNKYWYEVCTLYKDATEYLVKQNYALSQDWMASENMVIPLMIFLKHVRGVNRIYDERKKFLRFWYWSSVFSNRYSSASNEIIITDCKALTSIAEGKKITVRGYFNRMKPIITEPDDLYSYTKKTSAIYRGFFNLLHYNAGGLDHWINDEKQPTNQLEYNGPTKPAQTQLSC